MPDGSLLVSDDQANVIYRISYAGAVAVVTVLSTADGARMTLLQIIVLALIQGLTEFLPVSSSAHLILGSVVFGWPDQGLVFDVATHLGTLLAVLVYFRRDWLDMAGACLKPAATAADRQHRTMWSCWWWRACPRC